MSESVDREIGRLDGEQRAQGKRIDDFQANITKFEGKIDDQKDFLSSRIDAGIQRVMDKLDEKVSRSEFRGLEAKQLADHTSIERLQEGSVIITTKNKVYATLAVTVVSLFITIFVEVGKFILDRVFNQ